MERGKETERREKRGGRQRRGKERKEKGERERENHAEIIQIPHCLWRNTDLGGKQSVLPTLVA